MRKYTNLIPHFHKWKSTSGLEPQLSPAIAMSADAQIPPTWVLQTSRSTGKQYYFNSKTNKSCWFDAILPHGWGWSQAGPTAPKVFVELATGTEHPSPPSQEAPKPIPNAHTTNLATSSTSLSQQEDGDVGAPSAKRARTEASTSGTSHDAASAAPARAPLRPPIGAPVNPGAVPGRPPALLPRMTQSDFKLLDRSEMSRPPLARHINSAWFGEPHKRMMRQLLHAAKRAVKSREVQMQHHSDGAAESRVVVFDVGCGTGAVTEFVMNEMEAPPLVMGYEVYGIDLFDLGGGYYPSTLREFGHDELAEQYEKECKPAPMAAPSLSGGAGDGLGGTGARGRSGSVGGAPAQPVSLSLMEQYIVNFWESESVTPVRYFDSFYLQSSAVSAFGITRVAASNPKLPGLFHRHRPAPTVIL